MIWSSCPASLRSGEETDEVVVSGAHFSFESCFWDLHSGRQSSVWSQMYWYRLNAINLLPGKMSGKEGQEDWYHVLNSLSQTRNCFYAWGIDKLPEIRTERKQPHHYLEFLLRSVWFFTSTSQMPNTDQGIVLIFYLLQTQEGDLAQGRISIRQVHLRIS